MNEANPVPVAAQASAARMISALSGVGVLCALFIVTAYEVTLPVITRKKAAYLETAIYKVLPGAQRIGVFSKNQDGQWTVSDQPVGSPDVVYAGYGTDGEFLGLVLAARGQGFQDVIRLIYGYAPDRELITGIAVLESRETPGLGDKIEKDPAFLANFEALDVRLDEAGQNLLHPIQTVKQGQKTEPHEIDGITGATISSQAIGAILRRSAESMLPEIRRNLAVFSDGGSSG